MATTKIKISFGRVHSLDNSTMWGPAKWRYLATIDGTTVGDPKAIVVMKPGDKRDLSGGAWAKEIDVSGKKPGDFIEVKFSVEEVGAVFNLSMGEVKLRFNHPFAIELDYDFFGSPAGLVFKTRNFIVEVKVVISESTPPGDLRGAVPVGKKGAGETFTTLAGTEFPPRVEVSPVIPVLKADQLPPRPNMYDLVEHGKDTTHASPIPLTGKLDLNALANPAFIPIISPAAKDFKKTVARLAVTFHQPHNLDEQRLVWVVKRGPVVLHAKTAGTMEVVAYAKAESAKPVEIELRWNDKSGPVLSTFRTWVGPIKHIPVRATIVRGETTGATPRSTPEDVARHIQLANVLLYQAGLLLVPDHDHSAWDGAKEDEDNPGIYTINTKDSSLTLGVHKDIPPHPMRLNFRPGAMHLCYIKSLSKSGLAGIGCDRPGLKGHRVSLDGSPSSSWRPPSGVKPDKPAKSVSMLTMPASHLRDSDKDKDYLAARKKLDPKFPNDAYTKLFGCIMPDYREPNDEDWPQTLAHEIGHVLGLRHRGNPQTDEAKGKVGSNDEVNGKGGKGHPWLENVMSYGYARSQDFDLIQTRVIRAHPCVISPVPKRPPKPASNKLKELQGLLGVAKTGIWDDPTEQGAKAKTVWDGSKGPVVEWVQKQLHAQGIDSGPIDAICGPITIGAIKKWQKSRPDLAVDGIAGQRTMQSLAEA